VDLSKLFSPLHRKIHADGYVKLVEHAPELWGMLFAKTDDPKVAQRINRIQQLFPSRSRTRFARFVKQFNPNAVLCTHYAPLEVLGRMREVEQASRLPAPREEHSLPGQRPARRLPVPLCVSVVMILRRTRCGWTAWTALRGGRGNQSAARQSRRDSGERCGNWNSHRDKICLPASRARHSKTLGLRDDMPVLLVLSGGFGRPVAEILPNWTKRRAIFKRSSWAKRPITPRTCGADRRIQPACWVSPRTCTS
jgi:processive 1,2-diacylglycerol beta-glucosyltransferase